MRLAERLGRDVDEILGWEWRKLQLWMVYDEVEYMIERTRQAAPKMADESILEAVEMEQERCGWRGVYSTRGGVTNE